MIFNLKSQLFQRYHAFPSAKRRKIFVGCVTLSSSIVTAISTVLDGNKNLKIACAVFAVFGALATAWSLKFDLGNNIEEESRAEHGEVDRAPQSLQLVTVRTGRESRQQSQPRLRQRTGRGSPISRERLSEPSLFITDVTLLKEAPVIIGGFADVFQALYHGKKVALKRMRVHQGDNQRQEMQNMISLETLVWQRIRHPYVLPFLGVDYQTFPSFLCLVSPWMGHGTILKYMVDNGNLNANHHIYEIAQGLEYLHSQNVIHGDLRGARILIDSDWHARIADFHLAALDDGTVATSTSDLSGSVRWMAPELLVPVTFGFAQPQKTRATDVYAFACTCLEVYTGFHPFLNIATYQQVMEKVINGERPQGPPNGPGKAMSNDLWSIVASSWSQQPSERPSMSRVVEGAYTFGFRLPFNPFIQKASNNTNGGQR